MKISTVLIALILLILFFGLSATSLNEDSQTKLTKEEVLRAMYEQLSDYCHSSLHDGSDFSDFKEYHQNNLSFRSEYPDLVIYNGRICPGFETNSVEFFDFQAGKLNKFFWFTGQLLRWDENQFRIHHSPCCADFIEAIVDFELNWKSDTLIWQRESYIFFDEIPLETMEVIIEANTNKKIVTDSLFCLFGLYTEIEEYRYSSLNACKLIVFEPGQSYETIEFSHRKGFQLIRFTANPKILEQIRFPIYEHLTKSQTVWLYAWIQS
jgi:hypothetical protein